MDMILFPIFIDTSGDIMWKYTKHGGEMDFYKITKNLGCVGV